MPRRTFIPCVPPPAHPLASIELAALATEHNPANAPNRLALTSLVMPALVVAGVAADPIAEQIAVVTTRYWGSKGRAFGVTFLDNPTAACKRKILENMNAWSASCNVSFAESRDGEVRISRGSGGYWSFLGTDILGIPAGQATMNLQGFTENTPESEYHRVVRHETGHTLGCPHEHMRPGIVARLDSEATISYFGRTQGWSRATVIQQVLTPLDEADLTGTATAETDSIMCYQLPAAITKDGKPIVGGTDITATDAAFMGKLYPRAVVPVNPPTPPPQPPPVKPVVRPTVMTMTVDVGAAIEALVANGFTVS